MKFKTFYKIYYQHRLLKANFFLKIYILLILPAQYIINLFYIPKKINLDLIEEKFKSLSNYELSELFDYFNSDKGNEFEDQYVQPYKRKKIKIKGHGYAKFYEKYLKNLKDLPINILEIGSFHGNASAGFFFYFRKAKIYGGDIFPDLFRYKSERLKNFYVNSSNEDSIKKNILDKEILFDVIIEDASHSHKDQIISLFLLFKILKKKGIFIIEELDFPDTRKDMNLENERPTLREILYNISNKKDFSSKFIDKKHKEYFLNNYSSINIFKGNFNEVAIITKK